MLGFEKPTIGSRMLRHKLLVGALAVVLAGGAGFAATGGAEAVRQFMIQVKMIQSDGQIIEGTLEAIGDDGSTYEIQTPDGGSAFVVVERDDNDMMQVQVTREAAAGDAVAGVGTTAIQLSPPAGDGQVRVMLASPAGGDAADTAFQAVLQEQVEAVAGEEGSKAVTLTRTLQAGSRGSNIVDEIAAPEEVFQWEDGDGVLQEVSVVRQGGELGGFRIYSTLEDGRFAQIGAIVLADSAGFGVTDLTLDAEGRATLLLADDSGKEISVPVRPVSQADQINAATGQLPRQIILQKSDTPRE